MISKSLLLLILLYLNLSRRPQATFISSIRLFSFLFFFLNCEALIQYIYHLWASGFLISRKRISIAFISQRSKSGVRRFVKKLTGEYPAHAGSEQILAAFSPSPWNQIVETTKQDVLFYMQFTLKMSVPGNFYSPSLKSLGKGWLRTKWEDGKKVSP